jgi:hypothetical protein
MRGTIVNHIIRFIILLALQVLVFNNLMLPGMFNPYIYIYFLLLLPIAMPRWQLLFVAFITGFIMDVFTHSIGMHAFACVLIGYIRPYILDLVKPSGGYNPEDRPTLGYMGFSWFLTYSIPLILIFHFVLFLVETLSVNQLLFILLKTILSSLMASMIIVLFEFFFSKKTR